MNISNNPRTRIVGVHSHQPAMPSSPRIDATGDIEQGNDFQCPITLDWINPHTDQIIWVEVEGQGVKLEGGRSDKNFRAYKREALLEWCRRRPRGLQEEPLTRILLSNLELRASKPSTWPQTIELQNENLPYRSESSRELNFPDLTDDLVRVAQFERRQHALFQRLDHAVSLQRTGMVSMGGTFISMGFNEQIQAFHALFFLFSFSVFIIGAAYQCVIERRLDRL